MPSSKSRKPFNILVQGDSVVDHHIYRGQCKNSGGGCGTRIIPQLGGAGQTANLLDKLCDTEPMLEVYDETPQLTKEIVRSPGVHHAYATWTAFPVSKSDQDDAPDVWRVNETFGFGAMENPKTPVKKKKLLPQNASYDAIILDEGGLEFRHKTELWPALLHNKRLKNLPWIILKMSHPVCRGDLWVHLQQERFLDRLIVIVSADDLRRSGASVSLGLSWEKSVQELLGDLAFHSYFSKISKARHIIVNFGHDGALWVDNTRRRHPQRHLIFDPGHLEGNWEEDLEGSVLGAGACLPTAVARALFEMVEDKKGKKNEKGNKPQYLQLTEGYDLGAGIVRGLAARRALLKSGHGTIDAREPGFPYKDVVKALTGDRGGEMNTVLVPKFAVPKQPNISAHPRRHWSIIAGNPVEGYRPLFGRARKVAVNGEKALSGIPFGSFGKLYTVDSIELNNYYGIRKLMNDYKGEKNPGKPLCLGVFGPPGSGKSFGIKEISKGILGKGVPILTFNLSQFTGPEMLIGALHQVRDEVLKGEVPVVFWDEFDTNKLDWLQFMLAPMNDGEFLEGQVTHPIGKCIFIFAGGTSHSLEAFQAPISKDDKQHFIDAKGPDFVSRLKGYLNVLGPNQRLINKEPDPSDVGFPIRRAIMLRVHAKRFGSKKLSIDPGLLNAMLKIDEFKHGARSMATIVNLTTGGGKRGLLRCNLPPREQLGLHVDYDQFMALVQEGTMFKLKDEKLAPHIHRFYLALAKKEGWTPQYPMPYARLPEAIKKDNIAAANRLPDVLSLVGLTVVDTKHGPAANPQKVAKIIEENLEVLAEAEHNGWMKSKLDSGWKHAEERDDKKKEHPCLVEYNNLKKVDKNKDRNSVRHFPDIVKRANFRIQIEGK